MSRMEGFPGFPDGKVSYTPVPNPFFSDLLPFIDNLDEMKVTLYAFWALARREGKTRYLRRIDFLGDKILMKGMAPTEQLATDAVLDGIERAVARGTFLHVTIEGARGIEDLYFLNTERGRAAVEGINNGEWRPSPDDEEPYTLLIERPNVYVLYEQNIGVLTPIIADKLRDAEETYSAKWVEEAIHEAVANNKRSWSYIHAILENWREKGKANANSNRDSQRSLRQQIPPEWQDVVKR